MGVDVGGTVSNVLVGSAILRVAPEGSTKPTMTGSEPTWPVAWRKCGYTEAGTQFGYQPTFKDINVDEEKAPIISILDSEKATISAQLAEATLENIGLAIAGGTFEDAGAYRTLKFGGGDAVVMMVALEGRNEFGEPRIVLMTRAQTRANMSLAFKRADKTIVPVEFQGLADSNLPLGERLGTIYDLEATS